MDPLRGCNASQANSHAESSSNLQMAHGVYHVLPASYSHSDDYPALSRRASLPHSHTQSIMDSTDHSTRSGSGRISGLRSIPLMRSLSAMKVLRPQRPASPQPSYQERPSPVFGSPLQSTDHTQSILERRASHSFMPPSMIIKPEKYRDTPIYTERGSPLLSRAYYTDEDICFSCSLPVSSCEESCIIHHYENFGDEPSEGGDWFDILPDIFGDSSAPSSAIRRPSHDSDLSFTCRGDPVFGTTLFRDEAAWLSSSASSRPYCGYQSPGLETILPELETEGWPDDASSCDGDGEVLECAMALAPLRAHVVDVSHSSGITIDLPPRSSSFAGAMPQPITPDGGRKSRMDFHDSIYDRRDSYFSDSWSDDGNEAPAQLIPPSPPTLPNSQFDLAMTSPPPSPKRELAWSCSPDPPSPARIQSATASHRFTSFHAYPDNPFECLRPASGSVIDIVSALEDSTSHFPSTMLLPDTPCISSIRTYLHHPTSCTLPSVGLCHSPISESNHRKTINSSSHRYHSSTPTIGHPLPLQSSPVFLVEQPTRRYPSSQYTLDELSLPIPNLLPLQAILPAASTFLLAALYAHVLAYNFLSSQLTQQPSPLQRSYAPANPAHPHNLASRFAAVFGAPGLPRSRSVDATPNAGVTRTSDGGQARVESLRERVRGCVSWLVAEIDVRDGKRVSGDISGVLLRALAEVVRGCEARDGLGAGYV